MIEPITMYQAVCDGCGHRGVDDEIVAWDDKEGALYQAIESEWQEIDGKLYCPECAEKLNNKE